VVPKLDKDHLLRAVALCEVYEVQESGLSEALNGDVSEPDKELLRVHVEHAREAPADLRSVEAHSRFKLVVFSQSLLNLEEIHHSLTVI
jgi:hypothetical protein